MSVRLRLTLLYSAILALTLLASAVLLYATFARLSLGVYEDALIDETRLIINSEGFSIDEVVLPTGRFAAPETFVQTRAPNGDIISRTRNLDEFLLPLSADGLRRAQAGENIVSRMSTDAGRLLVYTRGILIEGDLIAIIQVARSLADHDQALNTLRETLVIGMSAVTIGAFGVGWLLAGTVLRPINRIAQTARDIGTSRDFSRRVHYIGPPDELGNLTTTFNAMLGELQEAFSQEERALRAQRRFAADASHELRTPLTTIRGNIELLLREPPISESDRVEVITDIMAESERLIRLINGLLVLERTDAEWPVASEFIEVRPVIDEVSRQAQRIDPERIIAIDGVEDVVISGNRDALKQVLLILIDNALKYSPPEASIEVSASRERNRVRIRVRDSGPGIDPAFMPHIFERFYRGESVRSGEGTGLGLAIARALVEAQRGEIAVESQLGRGAVFIVSLPLGTRVQ
ncbi:MAG TPA: HAMP domain-containing sensor histidine kinase [Thermomicrobiales bacterium]|nr:HAMP domain-containing sensor histidine kinase [Thermomicrobiales bacterium]